MDIKTEILREHSSKQARKVADYVGNNPNRFKSLLEVVVNGPYRVSQRASWSLNLCVQHHPALIAPHFSAILRIIQKDGLHDAVRRNILRMLQFVKIPKRNQGQVAELAFGFLSNAKEPIAVRVFAMTVLANIAVEQPDLKEELRIVIEDGLPYGSAAYASRAKKTLKLLSKLA
jgi:hypothetical protein